MSVSDAENDILLSVIMACRNEAGAVGRCVAEALEFMELHGISGEVLVVDNASTDDSAALARAAGARVVYEARPGYGSAMLAGLAHARGVYGLVGDADGEYAYSEMLPLWKHLVDDGYDFVCGDRMLSDEEEGASPFPQPSHRRARPQSDGPAAVLHPRPRLPLRPARFPYGPGESPGAFVPPTSDSAPRWWPASPVPA